ncbi:MAG: guanine deaminase [bacterium]|jgi:guanine deaminase
MESIIDQEFVQKAINLALAHSIDGDCGPFGAVIVKDGVVVSEGWNQVVKNCDPTAHAEVVAIRKAGEVLKNHILQGCTIYSSCEPCPMCLSSIYWSRIDRIVYSATKKDAQDAGFDDLWILNEIKKTEEDRHLPLIQVSRNKGRSVFQEWLKNPLKQEY